MAKLAKMDRATIDRAEADDPRTTDLTYERLERALDDFEVAMQAEQEGEEAAAQVEQAAPNNHGLVRFSIHGLYGAADVVVEGPIENLSELQAAVDKLLRGQMREKGDQDTSGRND